MSQQKNDFIITNYDNFKDASLFIKQYFEAEKRMKDIQNFFQSFYMSKLIRSEDVYKLKPKYVIAENVKNILSERHRPQLEEYLCFLNDNGYKVTMDCLNACEVGYPEPIPQNRQRVFIIGVRDENKTGEWEYV